MYLYLNNLYTICEGLHPMKFELYPNYTGEDDAALIANSFSYPSPGIRVREIYEYGSMVAFVGRNSFQLVFEDHAVNYEENMGTQQMAAAGS